MQEYKEIILKSCNQQEYPDETIVCKVIKNEDINDYFKQISDEKKFYATKTAPVIAEKGTVGEIVNTVLFTTRNNKKYILSEESNIVGERELPNGNKSADIKVTNINSTSNEVYVVKADKFPKMYDANMDGTFTPKPDTRLLGQVEEDIIIMTAWGSEAVCLSGSYIVVYNAEENDFNTLESDAFESTYERVDSSRQKNK